MSAPVYKADVAMSLADALMRLGKNDWAGVRRYLKQASDQFELWLKQRPEKEQGR